MPRVSVTTQKHIHLGQLAAEMGGAALAGPAVADWFTTRSKEIAADDSTEQALTDAIAAHRADPDWSPDPELRRIRELGKKAAPKQDDIHEFMALIAKRVR